MRKYWLCFGRADKWAAALAHSMWGVPELASNGIESSPARDWRNANPGDIVFFFTKDIGVRAWGIIEKKTDTDRRHIWPDEVEAKKVIYNRRMHIYIASHDTERGRESIHTLALNAPNGAGFSEVTEEQAKIVFNQISKEWGIIDGSISVARAGYMFDRFKRSTLGKIGIFIFATWGIIQVVQSIYNFIF